MALAELPGMVGVIAQENGRYTSFTESLAQLEKPAGTVVRFRIGWDLADAHNALIAQMLDRPELGWLWLMADDHVFSPGLLTKLLARDVDLVVPLCLMRNAPYRPVNWVATGLCARCEHPYDRHIGEMPGGACADCAQDGDFHGWEEGVERIDLNDHPDGGLAEIVLSGAAGLLIRRTVLEAMEPPWFETGTGITNRVGEDVNFCRKARKAGFRIYCDLDAHLGHSTTACVWPVREGDGWTFAFSMVGGFELTLPPSMQIYADRVGA